MNGVSVIICTYNGESRIKQTLDHLKKQEIENDLPYEILLVDNASTDKTVKIAKEIWGSDSTSLRIIHEPIPGQANARITGLRNAKYEFCTFIDDDNHVNPKWVATVFEILDSKLNVAACGGKGIAIFEGEAPGWFKHFEGSYAIGPQAKHTGYISNDRGYLYGAGLSIKKSIYLGLLDSGCPRYQTGKIGSTLRGGGEDSEMCFSLLLKGYKLWYDERLVFGHYMPKLRLTTENLKKMQVSFAKDEVILSIYRSLLSENFKPKNNYLKEYLASHFNYIRFKLKNKSKLNEEKFIYEISKLHRKTYLKELFYYGSKRELIRKEISHYFKIQLSEIGKNK